MVSICSIYSITLHYKNNMKTKLKYREKRNEENNTKYGRLHIFLSTICNR